MAEHSLPFEIDIVRSVNALTFSANGECLVAGGANGVQVWRLEDGKEMATMEARNVQCLAVSKNDRWIAAGIGSGQVLVWDATTFERVPEQKVFACKGSFGVNGVDFSPDSAQLVVAHPTGAAIVWEVATCKQVHRLCHETKSVRAVKYSPQGDRIATATRHVYVWDSDGGRLLRDIPVTITPLHNTGLVWSNDHLFVLSDGTIKEFKASTGSIVSERSALDARPLSSIALSQNGEFIAYSTQRTMSFWDTSTHAQLAVVRHPQNIHSIAFSPDDRFFAVGGDEGKITIRSLSRITDSIPLSRLHPTFQEPEILIDDDALDAWKQHQLEEAKRFLTGVIQGAHNPSHHALASRALVRARLQEWDAAILDAEEAVKIQPCVVGYIAQSVALVGKGKVMEGYRACDIAFERFHSSHVTFLLLIKAIVVFMAGEHVDALSRVDDLITTVQFNSICYVVQAYMYFLLGNLRMVDSDYEGAIRSFERARGQLRPYPTQSLFLISLIFGWKFDNLEMIIRQRLCEALYSAGRTEDASESLLELVHTFENEVYIHDIIVGLDSEKEVTASGTLAEWVCGFTHRCLSAPKSNGDAKSATNAAMHHVSPTPLLVEWAKAQLTLYPWKDVLLSAVGFTLSSTVIYQAVIERIERFDRVGDAVACFHQMTSELGDVMSLHGEHHEWVVDFRQRSSRKLEDLGDKAGVARRYDEVISHYTTALSLHPTFPQVILIKRSKAFMAITSWQQALDDADQVIKLDHSSPWGYEMKHMALHKAGDYEEAIKAFETMLLKMENSPDLDVRQCRDQYINPLRTRAKIRRIVDRTLRYSPHTLINTTTGIFHDRHGQAAAFEALPIFNELVSSMTTRIDRPRIKKEVQQYFRYAMLSHTWEKNEPLFDHVVRLVVYDLSSSRTIDKLKTFCKIARDAGFIWAWTDTCCINKSDHSVLQEALVAMFQWYHEAALVIVYLHGVRSSSQRGALADCIWNTRGWTLQEYFAAKVIRFYTEDWTLFLDLDLPNHKESPEVISEMARATGVPAQQLSSLHPGLSHIREKLCLASTRKTMRAEDAAYSLLGIFSVTSISPIYGNAEGALGRLLAEVLTGSGDASILAWTGKSGGFNSSLPAHITVFSEAATTHLPAPIPDAEMERMIAASDFSFDLDMAMKLYNNLDDLPSPWFAANRMKLPCIAIELPTLLPRVTRTGHIYRANTAAFGRVEFKTKQDLSRKKRLYLVHPWLDALLEREEMHGGASVEDDFVSSRSMNVAEEETSDEDSHDEENKVDGEEEVISDEENEIDEEVLGNVMDDMTSLPEPELLSFTQVHLAPADREMQARRFFARLRQPFGALLLTLASTGRRGKTYKRVAADSSITVRFQEQVPLSTILDNVRILDVL